MTVPVGPGTVTDIPGEFDQGAHAHLPRKRPGRHRWVILAVYAVSEESVWAEKRGEGATFLDHESRVSVSLGCYDCEQQYPDIDPSTACPAEGRN